jgi:sterol desaturase/sphingolipid hydroxylase (fatty acid hydroxylase superfamily)
VHARTQAFVPFILGLEVLRRLGTHSSRLEVALYATYINWYEIGSHSGKPVPTVTYFPPLSPLYRALLGDVDAQNVEFHERHHNKLNQNYGITQWLDKLLGTHKLQTQDEVDVPPSKPAPPPPNAAAAAAGN